ncbi:MAG: hypothetical protein M3R55_16960 [Acidobacteriota bacterium]|nr:hypothetical protein [Acidobacteriota bacterium]
MLLLWCLTGAALVLATIALLRARQTARRLEQVTQQYWDLRYAFTKLRAGSDADGPIRTAPAEPPPAPPAGSFVSLKSLKKKDQAGDPGE